MGYDYRNLSPIEFERLCADLVSLKEGVRYQRFGEGRDDGVDLMYNDTSSGKTIVQCKRYRDAAKLMHVLENSEAEKVRQLKPQRYCLLTSASLTPGNKEKIKAIFSPFIVTTQDIWGCEYIDDLLVDDKYRKVVYNIPSLWLPSFRLVSEFMSNAIRGRSKYELEDSINKCSHFAWTSVCDNCMKRLGMAHVVILVGDPGVGKTVAAEMLICRLSLMGYEVYVSYNGIKEFEDVYQPNVKQAFLYDDFLGSNYFDAVRNREDTQICKFASRVSSDPTKCFVLTSRTTILNRGLECSTVFKLHKFTQDTRLVDVNNVSTVDKAHILYKLIRTSCCDEKALAEYVRAKQYWRVIKHDNFNPRVIDYIVKSELMKDVDSGNCLAAKLDCALNHPMEIWRSVFESQINCIERVLVWATYLNSGIGEDQLHEVFDKLLLLPTFLVNAGASRTFTSVSQTLVGSLLKRVISRELPVGKLIDDIYSGHSSNEDAYVQVVSYDLQNHSIADYMCSCWESDTVSVKKALELLNSKAAVENFIRTTGGKVSQCKRDVLNYLISNDCSATNVALRLRAYAELLKDYKDTAACTVAFTYVKSINPEMIGQKEVDSFVDILSAAMTHGLPIKTFLQSIPPENLRKIFNSCNRVQDAIMLYNLAPGSVFIDADEVKATISDLLVEYGSEQLKSWTMPDLEFDEASGKMCASRYDIERAEEMLEECFNELISEVSQLQDVIDVWDCVTEVGVKDYYQTDYDGYDDYMDRSISHDYDTRQIDSMFSTLIQDT